MLLLSWVDDNRNDFVTHFTQLVQMVVGVVVNVHAYQAKLDGKECDVSDRNINLCLIMYTSYFLLFARFFYKTYLARRSSGKASISKVD